MADKVRKAIKARVKAKVAKLKQKIKAKVGAKVGKECKGGACSYAILLFALALFGAGCLTPKQASRGTSNENGDFKPSVGVTVNGASNTVSVVIRAGYGDGAVASADSSGSSESQTQTPTFDISPKTDVRYNDALAAASTGSKSVIEGLSDVSKNAVLAIMAAKGSGTIAVKKSDGTDGTVKCADGQCEYTAD